MLVLTPTGSVDGDSKEPFGTTMDAAFRIEQLAALIASVTKLLLSETMEDFIFCRSWGMSGICYNSGVLTPFHVQTRTGRTDAEHRRMCTLKSGAASQL